MLSLRRPRRFLRTALLVLLALGMVTGPLLETLGGLHEAEHALLADTGHDHAHEAGLDHDHGGEPGPDHATGTHGLLHLGTGAPATLPEVLGALPGPLPCAPRLPDGGASGLPGDVPDSPFRPPIA